MTIFLNEATVRALFTTKPYSFVDKYCLKKVILITCAYCKVHSCKILKLHHGLLAYKSSSTQFFLNYSVCRSCVMSENL